MTMGDGIIAAPKGWEGRSRLAPCKSATEGVEPLTL